MTQKQILNDAIAAIREFLRIGEHALWISQGAIREEVNYGGRLAYRAELSAEALINMIEYEKELWVLAQQVGKALGENPASPTAVIHRMRVSARALSDAVTDFRFCDPGFLTKHALRLEIKHREQPLRDVCTLLTSILQSLNSRAESMPLNGTETRILAHLAGNAGKECFTGDEIADAVFNLAVASGHVKHALSDLHKRGYLELGTGRQGYRLTAVGRSCV